MSGDTPPRLGGFWEWGAVRGDETQSGGSGDADHRADAERPTAAPGGEPHPTSTPDEDEDPTITIGAPAKDDAAMTAEITPPPGGYEISTDDETKVQQLGSIADGKYRIIDRIGKGGMGVVYHARDVHLDRDVAIKRIISDEIGDELGLQRFMREARAIARLSHPNIVSIYTLDRDEAGPFIVMEHIRGKDAATLVAETGAIDTDKALGIIQGVGEALAFAHRNGIYHRDVKPSNILIDEEGTPKLLDFGLAKMGRDAQLSQTGMGMGTLTYVAPEQLDDASSIDQRADIYSLAKTLYHLLTGERPDAPDLERLTDDIRVPLRKAMQAKPERRHFAVKEFLDELAEGSRSALSTVTSIGTPHTDATASVYGAIPCPSCAVVNSFNARFCRACGTALRAPCPRCNHREVAGAQHCSNCGLDFEASHTATALLDSAREKLEQGRFREAINDADHGIRLGHNVDALRQLRIQAARLQSDVEDIIEPARTAAKSGDLTRAHDLIERAFANAPDAIRPALEPTRAAIAKANADRTAKAALAEARKLEANGRLFEALQALKVAQAARPDDTAIGSRVTEVEKAHRERLLTSIRERTNELVAAKNYEQALAAIDAARERLDDPPLQRAIDKVRAQARAAIVNTRLVEARLAEQNTDPDTVRAHAEGVLAIEPDHREAARLVDVADRLAQTVQDVIAEATTLLEAHRPRAAHDLLARHTPADTRSGPLVPLRDEAAGRLERAATHLRDAEELSKERRHRDAEREARAAVALDADDEAARATADAARAAARAHTRTHLVAGAAAAVVAVVATGAGFLALQAYAAARLAEANTQIEAADPIAARAALESVPPFLAPTRIAEAEARIGALSGRSAEADALRAIRDLTQDPTRDPSAFITAATRVVPPINDPAALASATSDAVDATLRAANTQAAIELVTRVTRWLADDTATADRIRDRAVTRALRSDTVPFIAAALEFSTPPDARAAAAALRIHEAALARADRALASADAMTARTSLADARALESAVSAEVIDPSRAAPRVSAAEALASAESARRTAATPLTDLLAPEPTERARTARAAARSAAARSDWANATAGWATAAAADEQAVTKTNKSLDDTLRDVRHAADRDDLHRAEALLSPLADVDPDHPRIAKALDALARIRTVTIPLPAGQEIALGFVQPRPDPITGVVTSAPFYLGLTEVTAAQFAAVMRRTTPARPDAPVTGITRAEAEAFCNALAQIRPLGTFRLPTFQEWNEACRQGLNDPGNGWHADIIRGELTAQPVASAPSDALGRADMIANAAEWLADAPDPRSGLSWTAGGSYAKPAADCSCDAREPRSPHDTVGFRVFWTRPPGTPPDPD
jgi:serine/threonine protein kinase